MGKTKGTGKQNLLVFVLLSGLTSERGEDKDFYNPEVSTTHP
jgi:hypothetical protein